MRHLCEQRQDSTLKIWTKGLAIAHLLYLTNNITSKDNLKCLTMERDKTPGLETFTRLCRHPHNHHHHHSPAHNAASLSWANVWNLIFRSNHIARDFIFSLVFCYRLRSETFPPLDHNFRRKFVSFCKGFQCFSLPLFFVVFFSIVRTFPRQLVPFVMQRNPIR